LAQSLHCLEAAFGLDWAKELDGHWSADLRETAGTRKTSAEPISAESPVFTGYQTQKKTSVDVFNVEVVGRGNLNQINMLLIYNH
jgi:hypothetical protein